MPDVHDVYAAVRGLADAYIRYQKSLGEIDPDDDAEDDFLECRVQLHDLIDEVFPKQGVLTMNKMTAQHKSQLKAGGCPDDLIAKIEKLAACCPDGAVNWGQLITDVLAFVASPSVAGFSKILSDLGL